jgi:hypothetical protein
LPALPKDEQVAIRQAWHSATVPFCHGAILPRCHAGIA